MEFSSISDKKQEAAQVRKSAIEDLTAKIDVTNKTLGELENKYNEKSSSLRNIAEEKDNLAAAILEESRMLQKISRENVKRVLDAHEKMSMDLELKRRRLVSWSSELSKQQAHIMRERQDLEEERKKNDIRSNSLQLAAMEQKKGSKQALEQKKEKEDALKKILMLKKQLNEKHKLEMEIEELKGELQVIRHLEGQENNAVQQKLAEMNNEVDELQRLNQTLIVKERKGNDEFQGARKAFIKALGELGLGNSTSIGLKSMGKIDMKPFQAICKQRSLPAEEAIIEYSLWQDHHLTDPSWQPFKIIDVNGYLQEVIVDEEDEKLRKLRAEWGEEAYNAVVTALKEMNEHNKRGRYIVNEIWNFKESRKATLDEVIAFMVQIIKRLKHQK